MLVLCAMLAQAGCSGAQQSGGMMGYEETKSMVLDILRSEEGRKAVQQAASSIEFGTGMKMLSEEQHALLMTKVKDVLTDEEYAKKIRDIMLEPRFAAEFAKVIIKEDKELHKELLKDPEYQTMLLDAFAGHEETKKMILEVLKGPEYRKYAMTIFHDALQNPLFKAELMDMMTRVLEEKTRPDKADRADKEEKE